MKMGFHSSLSSHFMAYVNYRRRGGLKFSSQASVLAYFDDYLASQGHEGQLSPEIIEDFLDARTGQFGLNGRYRFRQVVGLFYEYIGVYFPGQKKLPKGEGRIFKQRPMPRIFSDGELSGMLEASKRISRHNKIRNMTFHAALSVAIGCGLRDGEVVNIHIDDIDFRNSRLIIRETKFGKSRIIPVSEDLLAILRNYLTYRRHNYPNITSELLFVTMHKSSLSRSWFYQSFRELLFNMGLAEKNGKGPHPHDLRHTFAVRCLTSWYRRGLDPQTLLPHLATYMGHTHYSDTAYYLNMTSELLDFAADSIENIWKGVIAHETQI